jgi:2,3-bisphosphoglycerate-dependent phosphoglycerate mutase
VTTVFLIRHAHSEWSRGEARSLSRQGAAAAQLLATRLSNQPITAIYSSPSRRTVETVSPLSEHLGLEIIMVEQLREREVPAVPLRAFEQMIKAAWQSPAIGPAGGESNVHAQKRGVDVLHRIVARHPGEHIVVSTHGDLLALMMNGLDRSYGYELWRHLTFPDVYRLTFEKGKFTRAARDWEVAAR